MPSRTPKQARFMRMCLKNPKKSRRKCPSRKIAREFSRKPRGGYR